MMMLTLRRRTVLFGLYNACLLAGGAGVLHALVDRAREDPTASHTILVPIVTLALLYERRDAIFSSVRSLDLAGIGVIVLGLGLLLTGTLAGGSSGHGDRLSIAVAGLVVLWVGGFVVCFGWDGCRAASFPLLFLGFMVPLPGLLLGPAIAFLKAGSARAVAGLFTITGTPFHQDRFVFALPRVVIEIADECSGIRSSIALLLTSLLAADLFLRSPWTKALLVAAVLPIAILKNGVRIVSLSLLASYWDPAFLAGQLHHEGGILFFLVVLPLVGLILVFLRRLEIDERPVVMRS